MHTTQLTPTSGFYTSTHRTVITVFSLKTKGQERGVGNMSTTKTGITLTYVHVGARIMSNETFLA